MDLIKIEEDDLIAGSAQELLGMMKREKKKVVLVGGFHLNKEIAWKSDLSIMALKRHVETFVVRDLTDSVAEDPSFGNITAVRKHELVTSWVERFLSPTLSSSDIFYPTFC